MSLVKVSQLGELTTAADDDLLLLSDTSEGTSKKIQKSNITQENFTTTLKNKLDGIEDSATADQTAQEIATAIDADVTAETTLKSALGLGTAAYTASTDYATAAQGATADSALQNLVEDTTPQLGGTLDANGQNIDMGVNTITDTKVGQWESTYSTVSAGATNWDTAYSWGDHSTQSYATETYADTAAATAAANVVNSAPATLDTLNELAAALGDDPNFATTVSTSIGTKWTQDNTKISNWDTAYGWGDHASQGYATTALTVARTSSTGSAVLPSGTTAEQDASPSAGYLRYNTTNASFEGYNGSAWGSLGGASGAGGDAVFYENDQTVDNDYTITSGRNAMSTGPLTISTGVSVTVPTGSTWVIL